MKRIIVAFFAVLWAIVFAVIAINAWDIFAPVNPPQITYGEFPFCVEYELDGKRYVIEDTVLCEYAGIVHALGISKIRTWKSELKSGDEKKCFLAFEENAPSALNPRKMNVEAQLLLSYGSGEYYMDDSSSGHKPAFMYRQTRKISEKGTNTEDTKLSKKELEKYFGIKIIRFEFSKPIKNNFIAVDEEIK